MTNTTIVPLESAYKTVLTASVDAVTTTLVVDIAPSITVPAGKKIPAVLDPKNNFREVVFITGIAGSTLTVERGGPDYAGGPSTANAHSAGATIVITNPFNIFEDFSDAIDSKLDSDGGNPTTTWDLDVSGSNFRFRLDAGDMKFADDNQAEVTLSTLAAAAGVDDKAKVSAADTTSSYLATKIVSGTGASLNILNPAGDETLEVSLDATGAGVSDHIIYTPAFLTGGNAPEVVVAIWDSVSDGEFQITIDGIIRNVAGLDFQTPAVLSMADVAAVIQTGIRAVTTSTEICTWSGTAFIVNSANTTVTSTITVTSTVAVPAGTDISGAGAGAYMDSDAGSTAAVTAAVVDPTADAGKLVLLAASGNINPDLIDPYIPLVFGDGDDGTVTIAAPTILTTDMYYENLTINAGQTLTTNGCRIFVKETFTNNGTIAWNGGDGGNGSDGSGVGPGSGGARGVRGTITVTGSLAGPITAGNGGNGGDGGENGAVIDDGENGDPGITGTATGGCLGVSPAAGTVGGDGGDGADNAGTGGGADGGNGGSAGSAGTLTAATVRIHQIDQAISLTEPSATGQLQLRSTSGSAGSGGGAGGGAAVGGSRDGGGGAGAGGNGAGGGTILIAAKTLINSATGDIQVNAGNGGDGGDGKAGANGSGGNFPGGGGGGGAGGNGGNGGLIVLIASSLTNDGSLSMDAGTFGTGGALGAAGTGGTGGAAKPGFAGSAGNPGFAGITHTFLI